MVTENAGDAELQPAGLGERGALPAIGRSFEEREKGLEELSGDHWYAMGFIDHRNFSARGFGGNPQSRRKTYFRTFQRAEG